MVQPEILAQLVPRVPQVIQAQREIQVIQAPPAKLATQDLLVQLDPQVILAIQATPAKQVIPAKQVMLAQLVQRVPQVIQVLLA